MARSPRTRLNSSTTLYDSVQAPCLPWFVPRCSHTPLADCPLSCLLWYTCYRLLSAQLLHVKTRIVALTVLLALMLLLLSVLLSIMAVLRVFPPFACALSKGNKRKRLLATLLFVRFLSTMGGPRQQAALFWRFFGFQSARQTPCSFVHIQQP